MQPIFLLYKKTLSVLLGLQCSVLQAFFYSGALLSGGTAGLYTVCHGSLWGGHGCLPGWEPAPACPSRWGTDKVTKRRWQKRRSWNNLGLSKTFGIPPPPQCGLPGLWALCGARLGWQEGAWPCMAPSPHSPSSPTLVLFYDYQTQLLRNS